MKELIERVKEVLSSPQKFFTDLKKEQGFEKSFRYFAVLSIIPTFMSLTIGRIWGMYYVEAINHFFQINILPIEFNFGTFFSSAIFIYLFSLGLSFAWAGILHLWVLLFGGKETYEKTYQLSIYAQTPRLLLSWVPVIGALVWVYDLYLLVVGTEKVHGIPQQKALMMYLFPALFFFFLALAGIILSVLFLTTFSSGLMQSLASGLS